MSEEKKTAPAPEEQKPEPPAPEVPGSPPAPEQGVIPGMEGPPAQEQKVIDLSSVRTGAGQEQKADPAPKGGQEWEQPQEEQKKPRRGRPPKDKAAPAKEKASPPPAPEQPPQPRDASRGEKEEIVYLDLDQLHPFQNHPFGVRDDVEMQGLVESVKSGGVHQPALVRPREGGGYEIVAGHRRQRASELAGFRNMLCIVRNMTDDESRC